MESPLTDTNGDGSHLPSAPQPPNSPVGTTSGHDNPVTEGEGGEMGPFFHHQHMEMSGQPYMEEAKSIEEETKHTEEGAGGGAGLLYPGEDLARRRGEVENNGRGGWKGPLIPFVQTSNLGNGTGEGGGGGLAVGGSGVGSEGAQPVEEEGEAEVTAPKAPMTLPKVGEITKELGLFKFCVPLEAPSKPQPMEEPLRSPSKKHKLHTEWITDARNYRWRLMYFPFGNNQQDRGQTVSLYLEIDPKSSEYHGYCRRHTTFNLKALNLLDPTKHHDMGDHFEFTATATDWGFPRFIGLEKLMREPGFVCDNQMYIEVTITDVAGIMESIHYDSKMETGMVGLKNQGATCYMNSLLQTLWNLWSLRKAVYDMPTENENSITSVALALQRVFFRLQTSDKAVSTKELTKAFGWDAYESFLQQDVQELNRILCDKLEEKMKGTRVDGTIKNLFEGRFKAFTRCLHVEYVSEREETFYDIQLDVKGCGNLEASFRKYIELEKLTGDNQYEAEGYGKQDAERGVRFTSFPPVLTIHLKRFEFDPRSLAMVKINDRFEFPTRINLDPYMALGEGLDPPVCDEGRESETFCLHSVLVHSGDVHAGHYYAYIRPAACAEGGSWYKYDDECVTLVSETEALEDSYGQRAFLVQDLTQSGGPEGNGGGDDGALDGSATPNDPRKSMGTRGLLTKPLMPKCTSSAYMLVYVRERDLMTVMRPMTDADIPDHLHERFRREKEEAERRMKEQREGHLYTMVEVVTEQDVANFNRYTSYKDFAPFYSGSNLANHQAENQSEAVSLRLYRIKKSDPICALMLLIRERLGIPLPNQRLWMIQGRQNKTHRVDHALTKLSSEDDDMMHKERDSRKEKEYYLTSAVNEMIENHNQLAPIKLFLEHVRDPPVPPIGHLELEEDEDNSVWGGNASEDEEDDDDDDDDEDQMEGGYDGTGFRPSVGIKRARADVLEEVEEDEEEAEEARGGRESGRPRGELRRQVHGQTESGLPRLPAAFMKGTHAEEMDEDEDDEELDDDMDDDEDMEDDYDGFGPWQGPGRHTNSLLPARDGSGVHHIQSLVNYFRVHKLPAQVPRDAIILFFKFYNSSSEPPLSYLGQRLVDRQLDANDLRTILVSSYLGAGANAQAYDLYEEVTPTRVNILNLDMKLDQQELMNGDIIILQPAYRGKPFPHYRCYNRPIYPPTVPEYFHYFLQRRQVIMRPLTPRDQAYLEMCAPSIRDRDLEVPDRCGLVLDKADKPTELMLELPVTMSYLSIQRHLAAWLDPVVDDVQKIRFTPRDMFEEIPSRNNRPNCHAETLPKDVNLGTLLPSNHNHKTEALYFEVLPFSMEELDDGNIKDVILNDVRLREAYRAKQAAATSDATAPLREEEEDEEDEEESEEAKPHEEMNGVVNGSREPQPPPANANPEEETAAVAEEADEDEEDKEEEEGTTGGADRPRLSYGPGKGPMVFGGGYRPRIRKRCIPNTFMGQQPHDPPVLSMLIPKSCPVEDLLEVVKGELGLDCEQGLRILIAQHGRLQKVMTVHQSSDELSNSSLQEFTLSVLRSSVLDLMDPMEIELLEAWNHRRQGETKEEEEEEEGEEEDPAVRQLLQTEFAPLQVTFLNLSPDQLRSTQAVLEQQVPVPLDGTPGQTPNHHGGMGPPRQHLLPVQQLGYPLVSYVTSRDTLEDLLGRLSVKLGLSVETLKQWQPVLICRQCPYPLLWEEGEGEGEGELKEGEQDGGEAASAMDVADNEGEEAEEVDTQPPPGCEVEEKKDLEEEPVSMAIGSVPQTDVEARHPSPAPAPESVCGEQPPDGVAEGGGGAGDGEEEEEHDSKKRKAGEGPEDEKEEEEEEGGSRKKPRAAHGTRLWRMVSTLFPLMVCRGVWEVHNWGEAPLLTFLRAEGMGPASDVHFRDESEPRKRTRRCDQGIKIRDS